MTFYHGSLEFERTRQPLAQYQVEVVYVVDQPVESPIPLADGRQLTVQTYPALPLVASLISTRPDHERWQDAELSWRWLHQRDYRLAAPTREIYLRRPRHHGEYLTEIQFPLVSKEKES
jgi:effector-binding domain-containing protein